MKPVFIHINKNAGTSINRAAADHVRTAGHRTAQSWVHQYGQDAPLFAVVRDPYERVISEYRYRRQRFLNGEQNEHLTSLAKPFDEWVLSTYQGDEFRTQAYFDRTGAFYNPGNMVGDTLIWFISQAKWLSDANGELLVDDVLRFETLEDDWRNFSAKYGFVCELGYSNWSQPVDDLDDRFTQDVREAIFEYYHEDFEFFGYPRRP